MTTTLSFPEPSSTSVPLSVIDIRPADYGPPNPHPRVTGPEHKYTPWPVHSPKPYSAEVADTVVGDCIAIHPVPLPLPVASPYPFAGQGRSTVVDPTLLVELPSGLNIPVSS